MELPIKKTEARLSPTSMILYGMPKVGKSTLVSQLEDCLIVSTEKSGYNALSVLKIDVLSLSDYRSFIGLLKKSNARYKYIVIDTIDIVEDWADDSATNDYNKKVTAEKAIESVKHIGNGYGYRQLREKFKSMVEMLLPHCECVVFIGHVRDKYITMDGQLTDNSTNMLDLSGKIRKMMAASVDAMGYVYRDGTKTCINFSSEDICVGSRYKHLQGVVELYDSVTEKCAWDKVFID